MKPSLILDVDGVLANLETSFIAQYNKDFNDTATHFADWEGTNLKASWEYKEALFSSSYFFKNLDPIFGAKEAVLELTRLFDITIATVSHPDAVPGKLDWLDEHFRFIKNKAILISDDFSIKKDMNGFVMLDDRPKHLEGFSGIPVCFGNNKYNEDYRGIKVKNWTEAKHTLVEISKLYKTIKNIESKW